MEDLWSLEAETGPVPGFCCLRQQHQTVRSRKWLDRLS